MYAPSNTNPTQKTHSPIALIGLLNNKRNVTITFLTLFKSKSIKGNFYSNL